MRLIDNDQLKAGHAIRTAKRPLELFIDGLKSLYLAQIKGFNMDKICSATIIMEGTPKEVDIQEENINSIAYACNGVSAGEKLGKQGYQLTFVISYMRVQKYLFIYVCLYFH